MYEIKSNIRSGKKGSIEFGKTYSESELVDLGIPKEQIPSLVTDGAIAPVEAPSSSEPPPTVLVTDGAIAPVDAPSSSEPPPSVTPDPSLLNTNLINLNEASEEELVALPHIGKAIAKKLMEARPFETLEDAAKASGLKPEQWAQVGERVKI